MTAAPTKVSIVTGAGGGIGAAVAAKLVQVGHEVVAADLPAAIERLGDAGPVAGEHRVGFDVADSASRARLVASTYERFGRIDALVNCAGVLMDARLSDIDDSTLAPTLRVNLVGALSLARQVVPLIAASGGGAIVNIASRAWLGIFGSASYSMSKGALIGAVRSLALEAGPSGVTVNAIAPGFIETPMSQGLPQKVLHRTLAAIAVGRGGVPDDVADAVSFLVNNAPYVTGQVLPVCGGRSIGEPVRPAGGVVSIHSNNRIGAS
jgi:3-oxoacyl-[acyl-carrier protein] reductase